MTEEPKPADGAPQRTMPCPRCDDAMRATGGQQVHDLYAERWECPRCGHEIFRSVGRGSI